MGREVSAFGDSTASYEGWLRVARGDASVGAVIVGGQLISTVEFMKDKP